MPSTEKRVLQAFQVDELMAAAQPSHAQFQEFLRVPAMSLGLYTLPAGSTDPQHPHSEDEVYYILEGAGMIRVEGEDRPVAPGAIIFVPAQAEHRFHSITVDLQVLVFFAPAEGSAATA